MSVHPNNPDRHFDHWKRKRRFQLDHRTGTTSRERRNEYMKLYMRRRKARASAQENTNNALR